VVASQANRAWIAACRSPRVAVRGICTLRQDSGFAAPESARTVVLVTGKRPEGLGDPGAQEDEFRPGERWARATPPIPRTSLPPPDRRSGNSRISSCRRPGRQSSRRPAVLVRGRWPSGPPARRLPAGGTYAATSTVRCGALGGNPPCRHRGMTPDRRTTRSAPADAVCLGRWVCQLLEESRRRSPSRTTWSRCRALASHSACSRRVR
jgi:hypothetical protein